MCLNIFFFRKNEADLSEKIGLIVQRKKEADSLTYQYTFVSRDRAVSSWDKKLNDLDNLTRFELKPVWTDKFTT